MTSTSAYCQQLARDTDRDRYLAGLFAPQDARGDLFALYAFSSEIARVRELVSDPLPGEVRLQWWRDLLNGAAHGEAQRHPVAAAFLPVIESCKLPLSSLLNLIDARVFDLYDDPMPSLNDLEGYAGETSSAVFQLGAIILSGGQDPKTAEIAGYAGVAYALTGLMRALPWHASRGQLYLPSDVLDRHGVDRASIFRGENTKELQGALAELREHVRHHLSRTRKLTDTIPRACLPAFLPVCLLEPYLAEMEKPGFDPLRSSVELSQLRRQWRLWRAQSAGLGKL